MAPLVPWVRPTPDLRHVHAADGILAAEVVGAHRAHVQRAGVGNGGTVRLLRSFTASAMPTAAEDSPKAAAPAALQTETSSVAVTPRRSAFDVGLVGQHGDGLVVELRVGGNDVDHEPSPFRPWASRQ